MSHLEMQKQALKITHNVIKAHTVKYAIYKARASKKKLKWTNKRVKKILRIKFEAW